MTIFIFGRKYWLKQQLPINILDYQLYKPYDEFIVYFRLC